MVQFYTDINWKSCRNAFAISHCDFKIENETACSNHMLKTIVATRLKTRNFYSELRFFRLVRIYMSLLFDLFISLKYNAENRY